MASLKIYMFDNNTGAPIPEQIDTYKVELLVGNSISDLKSKMDQCQLFVVFTKLSDVDIVVKSETDANALRSILQFGKYDYKVEEKSSSIWYSDKADHNIIISDAVKLTDTELATILKLYLSNIGSGLASTTTEMYTVTGIRNDKILIKTPSLNEATTVCNQNPGTIIVNSKNQEIYRSTFGRVKPRVSKSLKESKYIVQKKNQYGVFGVKSKL